METQDPLAIAAVSAIQTGDIGALKHLLADNPGLSTARLGMSRTLLHIATDWPGNFPNVAETIKELIRHGADVNARFTGPHTETPLHWAASCDDVSALDALLDHGADIEAPGGVIGNGTPLADAVAFGQWKTARRLIERGARTSLWQAAGMGLIERLREHLSAEPPPPAAEITSAFWCACNGGHRESAEHLLARGADINWVGYDRLTPLQAAKRSGAEELADWLASKGAK
jgi:ankyrin repeat protein